VVADNSAGVWSAYVGVAEARCGVVLVADGLFVDWYVCVRGSGITACCCASAFDGFRHEELSQLRVFGMYFDQGRGELFIYSIRPKFV